ncbi:riboflavin biosynthesis protein RibF [Fannyhessea vaginae]|uniref:Riboflavin kinase n=2 Tax=Fannyhessea vaginae TaxID=82135 RepID=F1T4R1_9ACTN|nr:riboflavin kinase [Fannyhessea vaginae]EGF23705.1 riboflavin kinase [Fannyhessea vaginae DSM 15829]QPR42312.1 riboflavin biosynthesis protein RibF [Fannyhessea vaginae]
MVVSSQRNISFDSNDVLACANFTSYDVSLASICESSSIYPQVLSTYQRLVQDGITLYVAPHVAYTSRTPSCVAFGVFDGFHVGHQRLLHKTLESAHAHNLTSAVVTFDPDPSSVLHSQAPASCALDLDACLLTTKQRLELIARTHVDLIVVVAFTPALAKLEYQKFLTDVVMKCLAPRIIHVGADFKMGYRGQGDIAALRAFGSLHDIDVFGHGLAVDNEVVISATLIRTLLQNGDIDLATRYLTRFYSLSGKVIHGRGKGSGFGFATANILCQANHCVPQPGVYMACVVCQNHIYPAAVNVGISPTFSSEIYENEQGKVQDNLQNNAQNGSQDNVEKTTHDSRRRLLSRQGFLEAHLLGFTGDIYGQTVDVIFVKRMRDARKFESVSALIKVVHDNIKEVKNCLGETGIEVYRYGNRR